MDFLEFFAIVETGRDLLNPMGEEKILRAAEYAGVGAGTRVLDIGSGKGAMLRTWARRWPIVGTGVELNPAFVQAARTLSTREGSAGQGDLRYWEGRALDFAPNPAGYDVTACLGAPFAIGTFAEAAAWLTAHTMPGGHVVMGDVYLRAPIPDGVWAGGDEHPPTLAGLADTFSAAGLETVGLLVSTRDEWDHYSSLMWGAVDTWAAANPQHPNRAEVLAMTRQGRADYLRWEREHLGWAVLVGRQAR